MRPPDAVGAHIRRALLFALALDAVIKRMGNEQVYTAYCQPVGVPLHIAARKLPRVAVFVAGTKAFIGVAAAAHQAGSVGTAFGHGGVHPRKAVLFGSQPAQHKVLAGDGKVLFHLNVITLVGVAHQPNVVCFAPAGQAAVINFTLAGKDQLVVQLCVRVLFALEQRRQPCQIAALGRKQFGKAVGPGEHPPDIAAKNTRLISEKSNDRATKIFFQFPVVGFVC